MPSSYVDSVPPIVHLLTRVSPKRVVDIGPGWGKYGLMCREYLPGLERLEAVEVPEGVKPTQRAIYDAIVTDDVRAVSPTHWADFDLALLIDVIEHMTKAEGRRLVEEIIGQGCQVLVSTPKVFFHQHDEDNPYEEHVSLWAWNDFPPAAEDVSTIDALIFLLGTSRTPTLG